MTSRLSPVIAIITCGLFLVAPLRANAIESECFSGVPYFGGAAITVWSETATGSIDYFLAGEVNVFSHASHMSGEDDWQVDYVPKGFGQFVFVRHFVGAGAPVGAYFFQTMSGFISFNTGYASSDACTTAGSYYP